MKKNGLRIVVACGGTGGHVFPGVATALRLRERGHEVELWLAGRDIEKSLAGAWDGAVHPVGIRPVPWRSPLKACAGIGSQLSAFARLRARLGRERADAILAMGGYAGVAPVLAARSRGVTVILHESNAVPGRANTVLSRLARVTALAFQSANRFLPGRVTQWTGMPVRRDLLERRPLDGIVPESFTVLVMGGSQGAHRLNVLAGEALCRFPPAEARGLSVIHLAGERDAAEVRSLYREAGIEAQVFGFLSDIGRAYAAADAVICRAGAASCAELCLAGLPALLVPLPNAARDHQTANARVMAEAGASEYCAQADLTPERAKAFIRSIRDDVAKRESMRNALAGMARAGADDNLADLIERAAEAAILQYRRV